MKSLSAIIIITFFSAAAYGQAGKLDSTFGTNGVVLTAIGSTQDQATAVLVQTDGKIVAAGNSNNGSNVDFVLVRYNYDGSLDNSFGQNGKVTTDINNENNSASSLALQSDGKLIAAGESHNGFSTDFALVDIIKMAL